jgi:uncharacterized protein (TIGR02246 family)
MNRKRILLAAGLALLILGVGIMTAQDKKEADKKDKDPAREADKLAIDKLLKEQIQAFNNRDAAAIAANWTAEGEFIRNDGEPIRGRAEVQKGYAEFFQALKGKPKLEAQVDGLRFTSADSAVSEVTLRLKNEEGEVIASSWRNTLLVREGGQWKVAIAQEWDRDDGLDMSLKDLEWLIGTWHVATKDREVTTVYEWDENKVFIRGKYTVKDKEKDKVIESGTLMIAKDNYAAAIHSWVFQSDGGFGDGVWTRDGKKWFVDFDGVTADGFELTATAIYVHVDANTYTWQSVDQEVDGEPIPDTKPVKVTKQKPEK